MVSFRCPDMAEVARELVGTAKKNGVGQARTVRDIAREGARDTARSAKATARSHGKHYPRSIKAVPMGATTWQWGPQGGPQSGMSFEYGSRNQPPHLNHVRAGDEAEAKLPGRAEQTAYDSFPGSWK